jgi:phosphatidylserine/phosphatidylglycerophosphate/cardiolipin synthase-like enzyme
VKRLYPLARSLCEAVGWDAAVIVACLDGKVSTEIDERCRELNLLEPEKRSALALARDIATAVAEREHSLVRVLSSQPRLIADAGRLWGVGQEWLELIRRARHKIIIVSPSLDEVAAKSLCLALSAAFHAGTGLTVVHGSLGRLERITTALRVYRDAFPDAEVLEWPSGVYGFLHAKMICVDSDTVYMGSANVTEYGWEKNIEVGVTLRGPVARPLVKYCEGLASIARGTIPVKP